jgi:hydroxymethylglutaryl-CoA synthase
MHQDYMSSPDLQQYSNIPETYRHMSDAQSLSDKSVEKSFLSLASVSFKKSVVPSLSCAKRCGNMYTASLYGGLASILANVEPEQLLGKRISLYAFGSGCSSSFYAIRVNGDTSEMREKMDLIGRLQSMKVVSCEEYVEAMKVRDPYVVFPVPNRNILAAGKQPQCVLLPAPRRYRESVARLILSQWH